MESDKRRVVFVNRSYWPDAEATGQLLTELTEGLAARDDLQVSVLCGQPNIIVGEAKFLKNGVEHRNGVEIVRVKHTQYNKSTFFGRITNFLTFLIAAFWKTLWIKKPDLMVVETDPPLLCLLGCVISRIRGIKYVCYLQDIYPDIAVELGRLKEGLLTKALRWSFLNAYRNASKVVVVGSDMKNWLINHRVDAEKIVLVENWVDTELIHPVKTDNAFRRNFHLEDKFVVMYSGNIGYTQRFDLVLNAAASLRDHPDIIFVFVGNGVKRSYVFEEMIARSLPNIRFMDYQPKANLKDSLSAADAHLVLLNSNLTQHMMPSKAYSALASGTPIIGIGASKTRVNEELTVSHLANMIESNDVGVFVDEDSGDLTSQILELRADEEGYKEMAKNARLAAESLHTREVSVEKFEQLLEGLIFEGQVKLPEEALAARGEAKPVFEGDSKANEETHSLTDGELSIPREALTHSPTPPPSSPNIPHPVGTAEVAMRSSHPPTM